MRDRDFDRRLGLLAAYIATVHLELVALWDTATG